MSTTFNLVLNFKMEFKFFKIMDRKTLLTWLVCIQTGVHFEQSLTYTIHITYAQQIISNYSLFHKHVTPRHVHNKHNFYIIINNMTTIVRLLS